MQSFVVQTVTRIQTAPLVVQDCLSKQRDQNFPLIVEILLESLHKKGLIDSCDQVMWVNAIEKLGIVEVYNDGEVYKNRLEIDWAKLLFLIISGGSLIFAQNLILALGIEVNIKKTRMY